MKRMFFLRFREEMIKENDKKKGMKIKEEEI